MFINPNKKYQQGGDVCNSGKARNSKNLSLHRNAKKKERESELTLENLKGLQQLNVCWIKKKVT